MPEARTVKKPTTAKRRRTGRRCRYCGGDIASLPEPREPTIHAACLEQAIGDLVRMVRAQLGAQTDGVLRLVEATKSQAERQTGSLLRLARGFSAYYRALVNVLEAKGHFSREELRTALAAVEMGDQVDDLLKDMGEFVSPPNAGQGPKSE